MVVLAILTCIFILASLVPFFKSKHWVIRSFDFPRLQISFLQVIVLAIWVVFFMQYPKSIDGFAIVGPLFLVVALFLQIKFILPYLKLHRTHVDSSLLPSDTTADNTLRIMVVNVYTPNDQYSDLLKIIKDTSCDIVLTLESDQKWQDALAPIEELYPYTSFEPLDNLYGMHLYSKLELIDLTVRHIIEDDIPSFHSKIKLRNGRLINLHCLHPAPPSPTENTKSLERDAELLVVGNEIKDCDEPTIVMGDLNDVAWSHTTRLFKKLSGLLDPRVGRGLFNSYNAKHWFLRWPLDHLFHTQDFKCVRLERLEKFGSDHFPIFVHLEHCAQDQKNNAPNEHLDAQENKDVNETIEDAHKKND